MPDLEPPEKANDLTFTESMASASARLADWRVFRALYENMKDEALARMLMDELLRKVVMPGKDVIMEIWRDGGLL